MDKPIIIKTHFILIPEIMTFAGLYHIVLTRHSKFNRPLIPPGKYCCGTSQRRSLRLFAAKTTAHSTYFNLHLVELYRQYFSNQFLNLGRMLGRANNVNASVFGWHTVTYLTFQVEMLLATHILLSLNAMRRLVDRCSGVTLHKTFLWQYK